MGVFRSVNGILIMLLDFSVNARQLSKDTFIEVISCLSACILLVIILGCFCETAFRKYITLDLRPGCGC